MSRRATRSPRRTRALVRGNARYRRLWSAVVISQTGDWLLFIALPLYVLRVSGSALATSTVFLAELAPAVLVGTVCGPLLDRRDPTRLLAGLTAVQALALLPLLAVTPGRLWLVYLVAAVQAAFTSMTTPAQQAVVPGLVEPSELPAANALLEIAANAARLAGSPLGGVLLPVLGLRGLIICDAGSFLLSACLLAGCGMTRVSARASRGGVSRGAVGEGWRVIRGTPTLLSALVIAFIGAIAQGLFLVLFVLFVVRSLHSGAAVVGLLRGVQAVGGVLGGLVVGLWASRVGPRALTVAGLFAFAVISLLTWNSPALTSDTWWYAGLFVVAGIPASAQSTGLITAVQRAGPTATRGRVFSLIAVADALGQGAGILAAGLLSGSVSLVMLLDVQGGCYLACAFVAVAGLGREPMSAGRSGRLSRSPPTTGDAPWPQEFSGM